MCTVWSRRPSSRSRLIGVSALAFGMAMTPRLGFSQTVNQSSTQAPPNPSQTAPDTQQPSLLPEPVILGETMDRFVKRFGEGANQKDGFYPEFGRNMPGAGWIAIGPGYRRHLWSDQAVVNVSGSVSWREYTFGQARIEFPRLFDDHLTVGAQAQTEDWRQIAYFGAGQTSLLTARSQYGLRASDFAIFASMHPTPVVEVRVRGGVLPRPTVSTSSGWFNPGYPNVQDVFTDASAPGLTAQPGFWHADVALSVDKLNHPGHPTNGGLVYVSASIYRDRDLGQFSFDRYEAVAIQCLPIVADLWTIAVRGTVVASTTSGTNQAPFYFLPSLGGQNELRGYTDDRFHDRDLAAVNLESRWALFPHVDVAAFVDAGTIAPTLTALGRPGVLTSYGAGLRLHTTNTTMARLDVGRSSEGWRFLLKLSDSLSFSTLKRWATVLPLVP